MFLVKSGLGAEVANAASFVNKLVARSGAAMRIRPFSTLLAVTAAATGTLTAVAPAASAHIYCNPHEVYRVTSHNHTFTQVDAIQVVNKKSGKVTLTVQVGQSHTSTRSFTGTITGSVEGGFWVFAKATAAVSAGVTIQTSTIMLRTYTAKVPVPGHSTRTVKFGFRRYNQYIQEYHRYNKTTFTCGVRVDRAGWVRAPYEKAFIIS
jgi:hypothetical protein